MHHSDHSGLSISSSSSSDERCPPAHGSTADEETASLFGKAKSSTKARKKKKKNPKILQDASCSNNLESPSKTAFALTSPEHEAPLIEAPRLANHHADLFPLVHGLQQQIANLADENKKILSQLEITQRPSRDDENHSSKTSSLVNEAGNTGYLGSLNTNRQTNPKSQHFPLPEQAERLDIPMGLREFLDDGQSPTYDSWAILMRANLRTFAHCFQDTRAIIDHIFAQTTGLTMRYLTPRMNPDHPQVFTHEDQIFAWLGHYFRDPNEKQNARALYNDCRMSPDEKFITFYRRFSVYATTAHVSLSDQVHDIFHKLSPDLHHLAISFMAKTPDYDTALRNFHFYDYELNMVRAERKRLSELGTAEPCGPPSQDQDSSDAHVAPDSLTSESALPPQSSTDPGLPDHKAKSKMNHKSFPSQTPNVASKLETTNSVSDGACMPSTSDSALKSETPSVASTSPKAKSVPKVQPVKSGPNISWGSQPISIFNGGKYDGKSTPKFSYGAPPKPSTPTNFG